MTCKGETEVIGTVLLTPTTKSCRGAPFQTAAANFRSSLRKRGGKKKTTKKKKPPTF